MNYKGIIKIAGISRELKIEIKVNTGATEYKDIVEELYNALSQSIKVPKLEVFMKDAKIYKQVTKWEEINEPSRS